MSGGKILKTSRKIPSCFSHAREYLNNCKNQLSGLYIIFEIFNLNGLLPQNKKYIGQFLFHRIICTFYIKFNLYAKIPPKLSAQHDKFARIVIKLIGVLYFKLIWIFNDKKAEISHINNIRAKLLQLCETSSWLIEKSLVSLLNVVEWCRILEVSCKNTLHR